MADPAVETRGVSELSKHEIEPDGPLISSTLEYPSFWVTAQLAASSSLSYFLVYFLRYPIFMLNDSVLKRKFATIFGTTLTTHTALSIAFCAGFGLAKIPAVKVMSSNIYFQHRLLTLNILNVLTAFVITLPLALSGGNPMATTLGLFFGVFPTSWVYGGLVAYFEGRCATETILAINTVSFIFAGSASRGTGQALVSAGFIDECWVPFFISAVVIGPIMLLTWVLDQSPKPNELDAMMRRPRRAMSSEDRNKFFKGFWPGLLLLILAYAMLTALRQFRDLFTNEIFTAANNGNTPSSFFFFIVDLPGGLLAGAMLSMFPKLTNNSTALQAMLLTMAGFLVLSVLLTAAFQAGFLPGQAWQMMLGATIYSCYSVAGSSAIWDRIVACSEMSGATCTFLVFSADLVGYAFSIAVLLWKTFSAGESADDDEVLNQFIVVLYAGSLAMIVCLLGAFLYFRRRLTGYVQ